MLKRIKQQRPAKTLTNFKVSVVANRNMLTILRPRPRVNDHAFGRPCRVAIGYERTVDTRYGELNN